MSHEHASPIKVYAETKDRVRYLAVLADMTLAEIVDRAVSEDAARHADVIAKGLDRAREVLAGGDTAIAAHLLEEPPEAVERVSGGHGRQRVASGEHDASGLGARHHQGVHGGAAPGPVTGGCVGSPASSTRSAGHTSPSSTSDPALTAYAAT